MCNSSKFSCSILRRNSNISGDSLVKGVLTEVLVLSPPTAILEGFRGRRGTFHPSGGRARAPGAGEMAEQASQLLAPAR
eukprot:scaffold91206_cov28-Tisochrysis_lutea.AAC.1